MATPLAAPPQSASRQPTSGVGELSDQRNRPHWFRAGERPVNPVNPVSTDLEAEAAGALAGQRVLVFNDLAALEAFLRKQRYKVRLLGRLDSLLALRIGFDDASLLAGLDAEGAESMLVFPVLTPELPQGGIQPGAVPLGGRLSEWLGIDRVDPAWGAGVKIAVLDTGVAADVRFAGQVEWIHLVPPPADPSAQNGHGTAVASLLVGSDPATPGVAPSAQVLSVRIAGDDGVSDSFQLAAGIMAAIDHGASLINISMGTYGDSPLVRAAVRRALDAGVLIVAAAGNQGWDRVAFPAAYDGVLAIGAVDALGNHLAFSNTGSQIDLTAPGFGVPVAQPGQQRANASGTSFSAPIVTAALAAVMTMHPSKPLSPAAAWEMMSRSINDLGEAGIDPVFGAGAPDLGRVRRSQTPGIYDAAVGSLRMLPPEPAHPQGQVEVLVQNRGTERLLNTRLLVTQAGRQVPINLTQLEPNQVRSVRIPASSPSKVGQPWLIDAEVQVGMGQRDLLPANNHRSATGILIGP